MNELRIPPNDPIFFLLHSFVDKIWEQFRQQQPPGIRETDYVADQEACNAFHYGGNDMRPFKVTNRLQILLSRGDNVSTLLLPPI